MNTLRFAAIIVFAGWVWQGPLRWTPKNSPTLSWGWVLFRGQGTDSCDVRFYERDGDGERYVERWRLFGYDAPQHMPKRLRVIGPEQLRGHVSTVCRKLRERRGGAVDVRATLRCPTREAWRVLEDSAANVCDPAYLRDRDRLTLKRKKPKKKRKSSKTSKSSKSSKSSKRPQTSTPSKTSKLAKPKTETKGADRTANTATDRLELGERGVSSPTARDASGLAAPPSSSPEPPRAPDGSPVHDATAKEPAR